jgi:EmrB/QacA subfamily drug resistance transporter
MVDLMQASLSPRRLFPSPTATSRTGLALTVIVIGVLIAAVDTTIVVLALPEMQRSLHVGVTDVIWVIISYLLVITLLATQVGRLGDMFGRVRMYKAGFGVFVLGSALCALAWNEWSMVAFRVVQGVGGALISANSGAVIADTFPPERRGRAYGFNAVGWNIGAILGIVLGGAIVTYTSWRWVFWINVPIGIGALLLAQAVLVDRGARSRRRLDLAGMLLLGGGLSGVLLAMTRLATASLDAANIGLLVAGILLLGAFVVVERVRDEPMVNLSLFRIPTMTPSLGASGFQALANFAVLFLVLMYLQGVRRLSPLDAALLLVPGYLVGGAASPVAGRIIDRVGPVWPATVGLGIQIGALGVYATLGTGTSLVLVVVASVLSGIGSGGFFPANNTAVMRAAPREVFGVASGMLRTVANVGMVFSFTVAILIASHSIPRGLAFAIFVGTTSLSGRMSGAFTHGLHAAFFASMVLMAIAAVLSGLRLGALRRHPAPEFSETPSSAPAAHRGPGLAGGPVPAPVPVTRRGVRRRRRRSPAGR